MSAASKQYLRIVVRLILRPHLWSHLWRMIQGKLGRTVTGTDYELLKQIERFGGLKWAEANASSRDEVYKKLGLAQQVGDFRRKVRDTIESANRIANMGGPGNLELLYGLAEKLSAAKVVETGVASGWSSFALLLSLKSRNGHLWSVDLPYLAFNNDVSVGAVVPKELTRQWTLFRMADREGLPKALAEAGELDLAHYDSDKSVEGRMFAYPLLWAALRSGGVLVSDDINDNIAFAYFSNTLGIRPLVIRDGDKYQGILVKP